MKLRPSVMSQAVSKNGWPEDYSPRVDLFRFGTICERRDLSASLIRTLYRICIATECHCNKRCTWRSVSNKESHDKSRVAASSEYPAEPGLPPEWKFWRYCRFCLQVHLYCSYPPVFSYRSFRKKLFCVSKLFWRNLLSLYCWETVKLWA